MYFALKFLLAMVIIFLLGQMGGMFRLFLEGEEVLVYTSLFIILWSFAGALLLVYRIKEDELDKLEEF